MAKETRTKRKRKAAGPPPDRRAERLEKALAAGLKREAKAASRLEAAQLEVAVLRAALAEVLGETPVERAPVAGTKAVAAPVRRPRRTAPVKPAPATTRTRRAPRPAPADR
jgi:hypothetical protein